jgi:hypothetical protein
MAKHTSLDRHGVIEVLTRVVTPGIKLMALADELGLRKRDHAALRELLADMIADDVVHAVPGGAYALVPAGRPGDRKAAGGRRARPASLAPAEKARKAAGATRARPGAPTLPWKAAKPPAEARAQLAQPAPKPSYLARCAVARPPHRRRLHRRRRARRPHRCRPRRPRVPCRQRPRPPPRPLARSKAASPSTPPATASSPPTTARRVRPGQVPRPVARRRSSVLVATWPGRQGHRGPRGVRRSPAAARASPASCAAPARADVPRARRSAHRHRLRPGRARRLRLGAPASAADGTAVVVEITQYPDADSQRRWPAACSRCWGSPDDPRTEIEKILAVAGDPARVPPEALLHQAASTPQTLVPSDFARPHRSARAPVLHHRSGDRARLRRRPVRRSADHTAGRGSGSRWRTSRTTCAGATPSTARATLRGVSCTCQIASSRCCRSSCRPASARSTRTSIAAPWWCGIDFDRRRRDRRHRARRSGDPLPRAPRLPGRGGGAGRRLSRSARQAYRPVGWTELHGAGGAVGPDAQGVGDGPAARWTSSCGEAKVILDADDPRLVRDVVQAPRATPQVKRAYELVEEFMIAANEAVGRYFRQRGATTVWRVHAPPKRGAPARPWPSCCTAFGIATATSTSCSTPLGMKRSASTRSTRCVAPSRCRSWCLRTLTQAVWDTSSPVGHFGLASGRLSPLHLADPALSGPARPPPAQAPPAPRGQASGGGLSRRCRRGATGSAELARNASSLQERRAMEAEREAGLDVPRVPGARAGGRASISATVSAVTSFGVFVEIDEPFVEGLIRHRLVRQRAVRSSTRSTCASPASLHRHPGADPRRSRRDRRDPRRLRAAPPDRSRRSCRVARCARAGWRRTPAWRRARRSGPRWRHRWAGTACRRAAAMPGRRTANDPSPRRTGGRVPPSRRRRRSNPRKVRKANRAAVKAQTGGKPGAVKGGRRISLGVSHRGRAGAKRAKPGR